MINEVDEALRNLVKAEVINGADVDVLFEAPTRDWASRRNTPTVDLYLYDIREDLRRRQTGMVDRRDDEGVVVERRQVPRFFKLAYLITAWTQRPEDEHRLLSAILACFMRHDTVPDSALTPVLRELGHAAADHDRLSAPGEPPGLGRVVLARWRPQAVGRSGDHHGHRARHPLRDRPGGHGPAAPAGGRPHHLRRRGRRPAPAPTAGARRPRTPAPRARAGHRSAAARERRPGRARTAVRREPGGAGPRRSSPDRQPARRRRGRPAPGRLPRPGRSLRRLSPGPPADRRDAGSGPWSPHRRRDDPSPEDPFRGLYLSDEHVDRLLAGGPARRASTEEPTTTDLAALEEEAAGSRRPARRSGCGRSPDGPASTNWTSTCCWWPWPPIWTAASSASTAISTTTSPGAGPPSASAWSCVARRPGRRRRGAGSLPTPPSPRPVWCWWRSRTGRSCRARCGFPTASPPTCSATTGPTRPSPL